MVFERVKYLCDPKTGSMCRATGLEKVFWPHSYRHVESLVKVKGMVPIWIKEQKICNMNSLEQTVLVTGGAGFIGTHIVVVLLNKGFKVYILDNPDNAVEEVVVRVRDLVGPQFSQNLDFHLGDIRNKDDLEKLFSKTKFDAVIHFASLQAVGESVAHPLDYFSSNLAGSIALYETMAKYNCKRLVFSSSATIYGQPEKTPSMEDFKLEAMNPYGSTKLSLEEIARDIQTADWRIILLGCFNAVGAHESGKIGEDPKGIPTIQPISCLAYNA